MNQPRFQSTSKRQHHHAEWAQLEPLQRRAPARFGWASLFSFWLAGLCVGLTIGGVFL